MCALPKTVTDNLSSDFSEWLTICFWSDLRRPNSSEQKRVEFTDKGLFVRPLIRIKTKCVFNLAGRS